METVDPATGQLPADDPTQNQSADQPAVAEPRASVADHAERLASLGYRVFPCASRQKKPFSDGWQEQATDVPGAARRQFERHVKAKVNVGIATGLGLLVLDVDMKDGKDGEATLRAFEAKHESLPPTTQVRTGSGGRQFYFRYDGSNLRNKVQFAPGLDLRTDGGLVIAPPSTHPNGNTYEFITEPLPLASLPPTPPWLIEEIKKGQAAKKSVDGAPVDHSEDSRNDTLTGELGKFKRLNYDSGTMASLIRSLNETWYAKHSKGPLPDEEIRAMLGSSEKWDAGSPTGTPIWSPAAIWTPLKDRGYEQTAFVVEGLLAQQAVTIFHSESGTGKTQIILPMLYAISQGLPFAGRRTIKSRCMYFDLEDSPGYAASMEQLHSLKLAPDAFGINLSCDAVPPPGPDSVELLQMVRPGDVIGFNSLREHLEGDENSSEAVRVLVKAFKRLRDAGATIIVEHHDKKDGSAYRGNTAIKAGVDWMWQISKTEDDPEHPIGLGTYVLEPTKARGLAEKMCIKFDYRNSVFVPRAAGATTEGDEKITDVIRANPDLTQARLIELAKDAGVKRDPVLRYLQRSEKIGSVIKSGGKSKGFRYRLNDQSSIPFKPDDAPF